MLPRLHGLHFLELHLLAVASSSAASPPACSARLQERVVLWRQRARGRVAEVMAVQMRIRVARIRREGLRAEQRPVRGGGGRRGSLGSAALQPRL
jgi:hypothetical protein